MVDVLETVFVVWVCIYIHSMCFALEKSVTWRVCELQNVLVLEVLLQSRFTENHAFCPEPTKNKTDKT